jgi:hypothetical protein
MIKPFGHITKLKKEKPTTKLRKLNTMTNREMNFFSFLFALNCPGLIMVFRTWFSRLEISTLGPGKF